MVSPRDPSLAELLATIQEQAKLIVAQEKRIEELERLLTEKSRRDPPSFVKPNRRAKPPGDPEPRKKRCENHARKLEPSTEEVIHAVERCPDCGRKLTGGWEQRRRQVIDIPVGPYVVRDHVILRRHCGVCRRDHTPKPDLSGEVLGRSRVSIRIMALVAHLRTACRLPVESIQELLRALYKLSLSVGEITGILHRVAKRGQAVHDGLLAEIRASSVVHADETGWREDGINGYLWTFSTPTVRWFTRTQTRGSIVPLEVLGEGFAGTVVADFYSGYSPLVCRKQRCWVHLLRDLKKLAEEHPEEAAVGAFCEGIRKLYDQAIGYWQAQLAVPGPAPLSLRRKRQQARGKLERAIMKLARPHLKRPRDPCRILAERIERFRWQLFVFVEDPEVPSENNAAERALRPSVIARKISGGTRSRAGSDTVAVLRTLYETWRLRKLPAFDACRQLLADTAL
jgi:transposase